MQPVRTHYDKLVFSLALLAAVACVFWVLRERPVVHRVRAEPAAPQMVGSPYAPEPVAALAVSAAAWAKPSPSSPEGDWVCDLFTPPDVLFDAQTGSFVAARSVAPASPVAGESLSLQLLAVKQEAYRLQLAGYFGHADDYLGAFVSSQTAETLLARTGHRFDALGLTLKNFDVRTVLLAENEAGPVYEATALAVLHDEQTGAEVVLDSRRPLFTGKLLAVFRLPGEVNAARELREGDSFTTANAMYRVERIQLEPAEVVLSRTAPELPAPELQVLRPEAQASTKSRADTPPGPPPPHIAAWRD
jgi:hypothetical protein